MQLLRDLAAEFGSSFAAYRQEYGQVHGFDVAYHPVWLGSYMLSTQFPHGWPPGTPWAFEGFMTVSGDPLRPPVRLPGDATPTPTAWGEVRHFASRMTSPVDVSPFIVRVNLLPGAALPAPLELADALVIYGYGPPVVATNRRGRANPLLGGVSVGGNATFTSGTLGGILTEGGERYATTCAHVLPPPGHGAADVVQPSRHDDPAGARLIGTVAARSALQPGTCGQIGQQNVDAALIKLDAAIASELAVDGVGPLAGCGLPTVGEAVDVSAVSGLHRLHAVYLGAKTDVIIDAQRHCFDELIVLETDPIGTTPVVFGDSGAWVVRDRWDDATDAEVKDWCGVVVGKKPHAAHAVAFDQVLEWAASADHPNLNVC